MGQVPTAEDSAHLRKALPTTPGVSNLTRTSQEHTHSGSSMWTVDKRSTRSLTTLRALHDVGKLNAHNTPDFQAPKSDVLREGLGCLRFGA